MIIEELERKLKEKNMNTNSEEKNNNLLKSAKEELETQLKLDTIITNQISINSSAKPEANYTKIQKEKDSLNT